MNKRIYLIIIYIITALCIIAGILGNIFNAAPFNPAADGCGPPARPERWRNPPSAPTSHRAGAVHWTPRSGAPHDP